MKKPRWTKTEIDLVKNNYLNYSVKNLQKELLPHKSYYAIKHKAKQLGIKQKERQFNLNHNAFKKINNETCYWIGLLAADGSVSKKYKNVTLWLAKKDKILIENFKKFTKFAGPIKEYNYKNYPTAKITLYSKQILSDLKKFNVIANKTYKLKPPKFKNTDHKLSYIIGYIDGDGTICKSKNKLHLRILGTKFILDWIRKEFSKITNFKAQVNKIKNVEVYSLQISGKPAKEILLKLEKIKKVPKLKRKWKKIKDNK